MPAVAGEGRVARGELDEGNAVVWVDASVCVVMASGGYPRSYEKGKPIEGLEAAESDPNVVVFHAGTRAVADGGFETSGGRVVGVTARGSSVYEARERAYAAASKIRFDGAQLRRDIASRALDH